MKAHCQYFNVFGERINLDLYHLALAKNGHFSWSKTSPHKDYPDWRRSTVIYEDQLTGIRAKLQQEVCSRLTEVLRALDLPKFAVGAFEVQLTSHNDGEYYKWHTDNGTPQTASRVITFVYYFHGLPKRFTGGDLVIYAPDGQQQVVEPINDSLVLFGSRTRHEVKSISCPSGLFKDGRFTLNGWIRKKTVPLENQYFGYRIFEPRGRAVARAISQQSYSPPSRTSPSEKQAVISLANTSTSRIQSEEGSTFAAGDFGDGQTKGYAHASEPDASLLKESVSKLESLLKLYGELHRLSRKACTIDVMSRIPGQAFFEDYYCTNRPVVLKGLLEGSKALKKWSPEFFAKNFGPTLIQVTANRNSDPDYERNFRQSVQTMTMAEFVTRLSREVESNDFYLVARNFFFENPAFKTLRSDLEPPSEIIDLTDKSPGSIKLWFGPKGTVTPLHHDEHSILFVQVYGKKHFKLIPSFDLPHVYRSNNYYSSVDPENVDIERQAKFLSASVVDVIVEPGDVLFIPVGWWHWVKALDISISATFCSFNVKNRNTVWKPT